MHDPKHLLPGFVPVLLLASFLLTDCTCNRRGATPDDVITPSESHVEYKYKPNVLKLTPKFLSCIKEVTEDVIVFKADTPKELLPKKDDVISSGICETFPHGINRRVLGTIPRPDGDYECHAVPAELIETFDELEISGRIDLGDIFAGQDSIMVFDSVTGKEVPVYIVSKEERKKKRQEFADSCGLIP